MNLNKNNRIVWWLSLLVTLAPAGLVVSGQTQGPNSVTEVVSLLQKHDQALNQNDQDALMYLNATGDTTVLTGTGRGEK